MPLPTTFGRPAQLRHLITRQHFQQPAKSAGTANILHYLSICQIHAAAWIESQIVTMSTPFLLLSVRLDRSRLAMTDVLIFLLTLPQLLYLPR